MSTLDLVASVVAWVWVPCWLKKTPGSLGYQWFSKRGLKVDCCCCCCPVRRDARRCLRRAGRVTECLCVFGTGGFRFGEALGGSRGRSGAVGGRWGLMRGFGGLVWAPGGCHPYLECLRLETDATATAPRTIRPTRISRT